MVKLIDVHRHLWGFEWFPPSHLRNNAEGLAKKTGRTTEQVLERIAQSPTMDATGQIAIDEMEHYCLLYTSPSPRDATLSRMPSYS